MGSFDKLKTIGKVLLEAGKIDLYQQLLDTSANLLELQHENADLKTKIKILEEKLKNKDELTFRNNAYWKKNDNDGPFCMRCWDKDMFLIRMVNNGNYYCPQCKNSYSGPADQEHSSQICIVPIKRGRRDWSSF